MKKKLVNVSMGIGVFIILTGVIVGIILTNSNNTNNENVQGQIDSELTGVAKEYSILQNEFLMNLPCGITNFDSPYVKPVKCNTDKKPSGETRMIHLSLGAIDENGSGLEGVRVSVNGGDVVTTDAYGFIANMEINIDTNKKVINLVADKNGYSPIRKVFNAETVNNGVISVPDIFQTNIIMKSIEVVNVKLNSEKKIVIISKKYPGVSVTIPANGLENSKGEVIKGDIVGEITYLNPDMPDDFKFIPGFEGNSKQMVGVNRNGEQVTLESAGMVIAHFRERGSHEILQPRKGAVITITYPILDEEYALLTGPGAEPTKRDLESAEKLNKEIGLHSNMSKDKEFKILLENDLLSDKQYWYFNQKTGLWEDWPISRFDVDLKNRIYTIDVTRLY